VREGWEREKPNSGSGVRMSLVEEEEEEEEIA
jgi:hypothetical protein